MALGIKSKPVGYYEVGDLIYQRNPDGNLVYYTQPDENSITIVLPTSDSLFGELIDPEVADNTQPINKDWNTWILVKMIDGNNGYLLREDSYLKTVANPEYDYPEKKSSGFNWQAVLTGINAISTSLLNIFSRSKDQATPLGPGTTQAATPAANTQQTNWLSRNWVYLVLASLLGGVLYLIFKKDKKPQTAVTGKKLNPNIQL